MKPLIAALALLGLVGCGPHADMVRANLDHQAPYGVVQVGVNVAYLIDPRTETCVLVYGNDNVAATQVSCAKLKKNVPEASRYITWDPGAEDASTPAPRGASPDASTPVPPEASP